MSSLRRILGQLAPLGGDAFAQLRAGWRAQALTLLGLVWGAAAVVMLLALGSGFNEFLDLGIEKTGDRFTEIAASFTSAEAGGARVGRRIQFTTEDLERLEAGLPSAAAVAGESERMVVAETPYRTRATVLALASPGIARIRNHHVARGRFYDADDEAQSRRVAVLGAGLVEIFFGDRDPLGRAIQIEGVPFEVVGILEEKGFQLMTNMDLHDRTLFVPLAAGRRVLGHGRRIDQFLAEPHRLDETPQLIAEARSVLWPQHHLPDAEQDGIAFYPVQDIMGPTLLLGVGLQLLLGFIGTVTLAMAAVGVGNLMIALVNERRRELAMRRACGARRSDLMLQLLVETLVVVGAGGSLGVAAGVAIVAAVGALPLGGFPQPVLQGSVLVTTFCVLAGVGLAAGVVPARLAAKVDPSAALRAH
jgi:putative ABC transport system permease protein